jgi:S1-C subfamily serine protease
VPDESTPDGPLTPAQSGSAEPGHGARDGADDDIDTAEVIVDATEESAAEESPSTSELPFPAAATAAGGAASAAAAPPPPHPESVMSPWPPRDPDPWPPGLNWAAEDAAAQPAREDRKARKGRTRQLLLGALAGGLVGALVASGVFLLTDDNNSTTTRVIEAPAKTITRPSDTITGSLDVAQIIARVEPAVVAVTTDGGPDNGGAAGTGFVITSDGYIATNNHVIEGANKISVAFNDGTTKAADLVGHDPSTDLAVLKVSDTALPAVTLGDSDKVQVGDDVVAIGNALALEGGLSVTQGIISGTNRQVSTDAGSQLFGMLQTDAAINPGNSGGPLVNAQGQVIGINTAIANPSEAQNIGFAIPVSAAKPIIDDLQNGRKPAFLGVATVTVTPAIAKERNLSVDQGALVSNVTSGSPADDAGIKNGDVITSISGNTVKTEQDVQTFVREHRPGEQVPVVVNRNGSSKTLQATLTTRPDAG